MLFSEELGPVMERIITYLEEKNQVREVTLQRSRSLTRLCANSIRATHRLERDEAQALLAEATRVACDIKGDTTRYPDIYYAGYVQDSLKELAEAAITFAVVSGEPLPLPEDLEIEYVAYLNGLGEATGEMRRYALDSIRRGELQRAEEMLAIMDEVYANLATIDYPDSMTMSLRRTSDMVRGVTERTRGDLTTAIREDGLQRALERVETMLGGGLAGDRGHGGLD